MTKPENPVITNKPILRHPMVRLSVLARQFLTR